MLSDIGINIWPSFIKTKASKNLHLTKCLRVPWTARRSNQSILNEINPKYSLEGLMLVEAPIVWRPDAKSWVIGKDSDAGEDWREEKGTTEDEIVGWHHGLMDMSLSKLWEMVKDRETWEAVVLGALKSQTWPGTEELDTTSCLNDNSNKKIKRTRQELTSAFRDRDRSIWSMWGSIFYCIGTNSELVQDGYMSFPWRRWGHTAEDLSRNNVGAYYKIIKLKKLMQR